MPETRRPFRIAIAEARETELLAQMLEREGTEVLRCPLVAIHDSPDAGAVEAWLKRFIAGGSADLVLYTGEGLRRLLGFADRAGLREAFISALGTARKITRGPKPVRALREIGLSPDVTADPPTTEGLIAALRALDLKGRNVAVQIYGQEPNAALMDFLKHQGARVDMVAPYVYASAAENRQVEALIGELAAGRLDAIAFTSSPQVARLYEVAAAAGREAELRKGLARTQVTAVGPVVADALRHHGIEPGAVPETSFLLKPMVRTMLKALER
jgi:uroporphyrinogen-III synthase